MKSEGNDMFRESLHVEYKEGLSILIHVTLRGAVMFKNLARLKISSPILGTSVCQAPFSDHKVIIHPILSRKL